MKKTFALAVISLILTSIVVSCHTNSADQPLAKTVSPIVGTWQLISGTTIEKGDTVVTDYTKKLSFIKVINETHFAFLKHDLKKGKDSLAVFESGGGHYSLVDSTYTEHLEYCGDRQWEGNDFKFKVMIKNDTLVQSGIEKVESAGIERLNTEVYSRVKN